MNSFEQDTAKINELLSNIFECMLCYSRVILADRLDHFKDEETNHKYIKNIHYLEQLTDTYLRLKEHFRNQYKAQFMPFKGVEGGFKNDG